MTLWNQILNPLPDVQQINGLTDELKGIYIYNMFLEKKQSLLFVTNSLYEANHFYQILQNYTSNILLFPMDNFLTSEALAISPELKNTRLETIHEVLSDKPYIVITNLMGYLRYLPSIDCFLNHTVKIEKEHDYDIKELTHKLSQMGYERNTLVSKTGDLAVRGFVIDVFPIGENNPIRIEFWGDTIESIRYFDIETQLKIEEISNITIHSNTEFLLDNDQILPYRELPNYQEINNILDFISSKMVIFNNYHDLRISYKNLLDEIFQYNISMNLPSSTKYMYDFDEIHPHMIKYLETFDDLIDCVDRTINYNSKEIQENIIQKNNLNEYLNRQLKSNKKIVICFSNRYQMNHFVDENNRNDYVVTNDIEIFNQKINLIIHSITSGFEINDYLVIGEHNLFGKKRQNFQYKSKFKYGSKIKDINKLNIGDYIVHNIHGIGRYIGLKTLTKNNLKKDYLTVEYRDGDKLYIPVEKMEYISKYSSNEGIIPKINKLGSTEWEKTKLRVRKKIEDIAGKLLKLYASRESSLGFAFSSDSQEQIEFEKEFPYTETSDQLKVIDEIKKDMEQSKPMDRLLCGDVGFGKTEVAFRAMFKAVLSGKQVALLCPTTILSNQHYQNALDRFKNYPINIALLNRFISVKQVKVIIDKIKTGKIDIVIGTHRILSEDIQFKDLGLLVIDEEQRFGVKHKEKIKELKNNIDVLTLSATPIPRTLQMSMTGIRNLSLIETPPTNRYPVQTYVVEENPAMLKEAIYKELSRNGQIFILYNKIEDMDIKLNALQHLVPDAKIVAAHGRMSKNELENVMLKFVEHEYDILLCTTIIETGIDIPNVNTLIIIDADHFGLSQLYQIRGRVGRSDKIAYCYLTYRRGKSLSEVATKRLKVIKDFTELGSGFAIAMRDLSIRGAGDILGSEQAGFIDTVGIELYLKMLEEEVNKLKGKKVMEEDHDDRPLLEVDTAIDDSYIEDTDLKIEIHKKINQIKNYADLESIKKELEDRFGRLSENMIIYMYEEWFDYTAKSLGITKVRQTNNFVEITLPKSLTEKIDGQKLFLTVSNLSRMFRFSMKLGCLVITLDTIKLEKHFIYYLIDLLKIIDDSKKKIS